MTEQRRPLDGIRVLEFGSGKAVKLAGRYLAGYGAEVTIVPVASPYAPGDDEAVYFDAGKRTADPARLAELAATSDVVLTDRTRFRREADGIGELPTTTIVVAITPYGDAGPAAERPSSPLTQIASGGQVSTMGDADREPLVPFGDQAQAQAALHVFGATMAALLRRSRFGLGAVVDLSIQELQASALEHMGGPAFNGDELPVAWRTRRGNSSSPVQSYYLAKDGWAGAFVNPPNLRSLFTALGRPELFERAGDREFLESDELRELVRAFFAERTKQEIFDAAVEFGAPFSFVADGEDLLASELIARTGLWRETADAEGRTVRVPGPPFASPFPFVLEEPDA
jgi:crotonobetainyl-CoA:carnitine CoA-transferase CaiB-like acyl-CoA transferase